jgi:5S rRNA maturation endonuclease (ribonuclease M5)
VEVLIDQDAVKSGSAAAQPWLFYDLGHGFCTNDFFAQCPHRMACPKCAFYRPKPATDNAWREGKTNLLRLRQSIPLREEEIAAIDDGVAAFDQLLAQLAEVPTPAGPTPIQLRQNELIQLQPTVPRRTGDAMAGEWVDFKMIKANVSMEMILRRYGVRVRPIANGYLRGACPLPTHQSRTSSQSFIVNTTKNVWSCQSASCIAARGGSVGGNVLDFVALMNGSSIRDAALSLQRSFGGAAWVGGLEPQERGYEFGSDGLVQSSGDVPRPLSFVLSGINYRHPYLAERGINPGIARLFGVGHYAGRGVMSGRIVIPIHSPEGALVAYVGRSIDAREPRYRFPTGFRKSRLLFNLHRAAKEPKRGAVVIVEGFFDCMKVHQAGYQSVVALMGSTLSERQTELLRESFQETVLMLDGDDVGMAATTIIAARLRRWLPVKVAHVPVGRQPDQLAVDEIRSLLDEAR